MIYLTWSWNINTKHPLVLKKPWGIAKCQSWLCVLRLDSFKPWNLPDHWQILQRWISEFILLSNAQVTIIRKPVSALSVLYSDRIVICAITTRSLSSRTILTYLGPYVLYGGLEIPRTWLWKYENVEKQLITELFHLFGVEILTPSPRLFWKTLGRTQLLPWVLCFGADPAPPWEVAFCFLRPYFGWSSNIPSYQQIFQRWISTLFFY